jgi:signal transduction histidine kinase
MEDRVEQGAQPQNKLFVTKKTLKDNLTELNQEIYRHSLELAETNRVLSLLREIDTLALDSEDTLQSLCQKITNAFIKMPNYLMVGLMAAPLNDESYKLYGLEANSQASTGIDPTTVELTLHHPWISVPETNKILKVEDHINEKTAQLLHVDIAQLQNILTGIPVKTIVLTKLMSRYKVVGILILGFAQEPEQLPAKETELIKRFSSAVGVALDNKLLFDENKRVLREIQKTNEQLKKLDETKDEFISMASHQLRTPLTSVKGYLSMVLEGDTGDVPEMQRKLLDQAFISSQRMVYLIADLLNVSRLRTGKFIIDPVPTQLADVINDEVGQLKETAKSRNLELTYEKPENFPVVQLDETKIRQVIMNFMDNAIYYTPSGGHIKVELKDTGKTVEYTVTDDGIGIPKWDQVHMFTKFYRAGNAKKARPDGTGLGLFMAKKVVVAQGGSIIFRSKEGEGSTFGFAFEKAKLDQIAQEQAKKDDETTTSQPVLTDTKPVETEVTEESQKTTPAT